MVNFDHLNLVVCTTLIQIKAIFCDGFLNQNTNENDMIPMQTLKLL